MLAYIFPIVLVVASNVFYNISQKSTPATVNLWVSLFITYLTAGTVTAIIYFFSRPTQPLLQAIKGLNWTSYLLGFAIVGLELGYLLAFRAGWNISVGSVVANIILAIILIPIGVIFYREGFEPNKMVGVVLCIAGLLLINR